MTKKPNNNMQTSRLPINQFTNAFTIYKSIYKGHLQKWLQCKIRMQVRMSNLSSRKEKFCNQKIKKIKIKVETK